MATFGASARLRPGTAYEIITMYGECANCGQRLRWNGIAWIHDGTSYKAHNGYPCEPTDVLTLTDIAHLAGVTRAAVGNWRTRHTDFPPPIDHLSLHPAFTRGSVESWLRRHGKHLTRTV